MGLDHSGSQPLLHNVTHIHNTLHVYTLGCCQAPPTNLNSVGEWKLLAYSDPRWKDRGWGLILGAGRGECLSSRGSEGSLRIAGWPARGVLAESVSE